MRMQVGYAGLFLWAGSDQVERDLIVDQFNTHASDLLVAHTTVAAHLDFQTVGMVIHLDPPSSVEDYLDSVRCLGNWDNPLRCPSASSTCACLSFSWWEGRRMSGPSYCQQEAAIANDCEALHRQTT